MQGGGHGEEGGKGGKMGANGLRTSVHITVACVWRSKEEKRDGFLRTRVILARPVEAARGGCRVLRGLERSIIIFVS